MKKSNRSETRSTTPLHGLFRQEKSSILAAGVHLLCADKKIREVEMTPKLADKILGLIKHNHGGKIRVMPHTLDIYMVPPVSKEKDGDVINHEFGYIPLARQLLLGNLIDEQGAPCGCSTCVPI